MWEWLLSPIDASRLHEVGFAVSWHARVMVLAWGILAPLAVLLARFFKVLPGQNWPLELDSTFWWRSHWMGQCAVLALSLVGLALVWPINLAAISLHNGLGYAVLGGVCFQAVLGLVRGTKGGPTAPAADGSLRGDHYDMTPWRRMFEALHKAVGYALLVLAVATILAGLWKANAPNWMWLMLGLWWPSLVVAFCLLQRRGMAVDTYQAIWGPGSEHPGNRMAAPGWGMRRLQDAKTDAPGDTRQDAPGKA